MKRVVRHTQYAAVLDMLNARKDTGRSFNQGMLRAAQGHLERARLLDADNLVAQAFLDKVILSHSSCDVCH